MRCALGSAIRLLLAALVSVSLVEAAAEAEAPVAPIAGASIVSNYDSSSGARTATATKHSRCPPRYDPTCSLSRPGTAFAAASLAAQPPPRL
jgi:hypothetical protein